MVGSAWWVNPLRVVLGFFGAWLFQLIARRLIRRLLRPNRLVKRTDGRRTERLDTLQRLVASFLSFAAFATAILFALSLFIPTESLVWMVGLFAGAFGFGMMPLMKDFFTGITYLFEDPYDVGEKVELHVPHEVEGVVEHVNLRTTLIRARTGELYTIPNGEIRVSRNFSRGLFTLVEVDVSVAAIDLSRAMTVLDDLADEALTTLPNLLEPWRVITTEGHIGQAIELKLIAKARYGKGAEMKPRLVAWVQTKLVDAGVTPLA